MISHLRGTLLEKHPNQIVIDVHGVGYEVAIPVSAYSSLPEVGGPVRMHIYQHVREDILALYGFPTRDDKALFEKLIAVSGIGPKLAITALSGLTTDDLVAAIRSGAVEQLVRIPGVGKKTAERMVLELRDKLPPEKAGEVTTMPTLSAVEEDVLSALMNLGYQRASAEKALAATSKNGQFDAMFRQALTVLSK